MENNGVGGWLLCVCDGFPGVCVFDDGRRIGLGLLAGYRDPVRWAGFWGGLGRGEMDGG